MPGLVVSVAVKKGDEVKKGQVVLNLEAMKMQTAVLSEETGVVKELMVGIGSQVDAKDLLAVIE
jgi:pyruvate carboxylase